MGNPRRLLFRIGALTGAALIVAGVALRLLSSRRVVTAEDLRAKRLTVAATIYPLYDIAREVAGQYAEVRLIVPPGASPHFFETTPRRLRELQNVKLVFAVGHGLDNWATEITGTAAVAQLFVVDRGIALRRMQDGTVDPHYWLHYGNARRIAENMANALSAADDVHASEYRAQAVAYGERLAEQEAHMRQRLAPVRGVPFLTFHDAWFYFAQDLGLSPAGTFESAAQGEPTPRHLAALQERIVTERIRVIFIEPQMSSSSLKSFAHDNGIGIAELDPLGGTEGRGTYLQMMEFNVEAMVRALAPKAQ